MFKLILCSVQIQSCFFVIYLLSCVFQNILSSPVMPTYDIWGDGNFIDHKTNNTNKQFINNDRNMNNDSSSRKSKVLNFFPVPVDDECLSHDGRRTGTCLNTYECRMQNGDSKGPCALGFGVCCVFTASCDVDVHNNITYIVSPDFPNLHKGKITCKHKIMKVDSDISQLRLDFIHFHVGQPNRRTGICDSDVFILSGGNNKDVRLCGYNSGQHVYYDVENINDPITITLDMKRQTTKRIWEIKVTQIPFTQRAPAGCLQFHTGRTGLIQTMNFAENGRFLANQEYTICTRQELGMCSIVYEPCDESSFRIGQNMQQNGMLNNQGSSGNQGQFGMGQTGVSNGQQGIGQPGNIGQGTMQNGQLGTLQNGQQGGTQGDPLNTMQDGPGGIQNGQQDVPQDGGVQNGAQDGLQDGIQDGPQDGPSDGLQDGPSDGLQDGSLDGPQDGSLDGPQDGSLDGPQDGPADGAQDGPSDGLQDGLPDGPQDGPEDSPADGPQDDPVNDNPVNDDPVNDDPVNDDPVNDDEINDDPGSGGGAIGGRTFDSRLFESRFCIDKILLPCESEDFIIPGAVAPGTCDIAHCGSSLCSLGENPCRVESTVTPFNIGIQFGPGRYSTSPEDNIGVCLRYEQQSCET